MTTQELIEEKYTMCWIAQEGRKPFPVTNLRYDSFGDPVVSESGWFDQNVQYRNDDLRFKTKKGKWEKLNVTQITPLKKTTPLGKVRSLSK